MQGHCHSTATCTIQAFNELMYTERNKTSMFVRFSVIMSKTARRLEPPQKSVRHKMGFSFLKNIRSQSFHDDKYLATDAQGSCRNEWRSSQTQSQNFCPTLNKVSIWKQILAELANMKFHENTCYGSRFFYMETYNKTHCYWAHFCHLSLRTSQNINLILPLHT